MEIQRVYFDEKKVLGEEVSVLGMHEVPQSQYNPTSYRVFECTARNEKSFVVIVDGLNMSDKYNGKGFQRYVFPKGAAIMRRSYNNGSKTKNEIVVVADEFRLVK